MPALLLVVIAVLACLGVLTAMVARRPGSVLLVGGVVSIAGLFELVGTAATDGPSVFMIFAVVAPAFLAASVAGLVVPLFVVEAARRCLPRRVPRSADAR